MGGALMGGALMLAPLVPCVSAHTKVLHNTVTLAVLAIGLLCLCMCVCVLSMQIPLAVANLVILCCRSTWSLWISSLPKSMRTSALPLTI